MVTQQDTPPASRARLAVIIITDALVIGELFVAMYFANANPDRFTLVFLQLFFGLLIPTVLIARAILRRMLQ